MSIANLKSWGKWFWIFWTIAILAALVSLLIPGTNYSSNINATKGLLAIVSLVIMVLIFLYYTLPDIWRRIR